jgi:hypothetical protein
MQIYRQMLLDGYAANEVTNMHLLTACAADKENGFGYGTVVCFLIVCFCIYICSYFIFFNALNKQSTDITYRQH